MWSAKKSYLTVYRVDMEKKKKSWSNSTKCLGWHFLCIFLANTMGNLLENTESKRIVCFHAERRMNGLTVCCLTLSFTALQNASLLLMIKVLDIKHWAHYIRWSFFYKTRLSKFGLFYIYNNSRHILCFFYGNK